MNVFILGQGGRESALARSCSLSPSTKKVHIISQVPSPKDKIISHNLDLSCENKVINLLKQNNIDLVIVGPEVYCANGFADRLRELGWKVFAPSKEASQLESSKIFAKKFMEEMNIPTSKYQVVKSVEETLEAVKNFKPPYVFKADGLAQGKGVRICKTVVQVEEYAYQLFEEKIFQASGEIALIEEFHRGQEMSFFVVTNGKDYELLPLVRDYKKLNDGGLGPNTGGMGSIAPIPIEEKQKEMITKTIVEPSIKGLEKKGLFYRGVLYIGLIYSTRGWKVLEYNVRFGDPEAQVLLPLIEGDVSSFLLQVAEGKVPRLCFKNLFSICVVLASQGYPKNPEIGLKVKGDIFHETDGSYFLTCALKKRGDQFLTAGGRVLNCVSIDKDLRKAIEKVYKHASYVDWPDLHCRSDIGITECL